MGIYGIYLANELLYIGQAIDFERRWRFHRWELTNNKHANSYLQRMYNKYGLLDFRIIEQNIAREELTHREIFWINKLTPLCNMILPGENDSWIYGEDRNNKVSAALKGKPKTAEHRKNISLGRTGIKLNYDPWNKGNGEYMRGGKNHFYGKHHSEETRTKISKANRIKIDVNKMVKMRESGKSWDELAGIFQVSSQTLKRRYRELK